MRSKIPTVFGGEHLPDAITRRAQELDSLLLKSSSDFHAEVDAGYASWRWRGQDNAKEPVNWSDLPIPGLMLCNVATSIQALKLLPISIEIGPVAAALAGLVLAGRFDRRRDLSNGRTVIFDVAHNPDAMLQLVIRLQSYKAQNKGVGRIALVLAMMADKDVPGMITALEYCADIWYIAQVDEARSMAVHEVAQAIKSVGISSKNECILQFDSVESAYRAACDQTEAEDVVLVTGSFFTVAAVYGFTE